MSTRPPVQETPRLYEVKGGWHAAGKGWAVFGETREEALSEFWRTVKKHREIMSRPEPVR
jgi:hypothetical protein